MSPPMKKLLRKLFRGSKSHMPGSSNGGEIPPKQCDCTRNELEGSNWETSNVEETPRTHEGFFQARVRLFKRLRVKGAPAETQDRSSRTAPRTSPEKGLKRAAHRGSLARPSLCSTAEQRQSDEAAAECGGRHPSSAECCSEDTTTSSTMSCNGRESSAAVYQERTGGVSPRSGAAGRSVREFLSDLSSRKWVLAFCSACSSRLAPLQKWAPFAAYVAPLVCPFLVALLCHVASLDLEQMSGPARLALSCILLPLGLIVMLISGREVARQNASWQERGRTSFTKASEQGSEEKVRSTSAPMLPQSLSSHGLAVAASHSRNHPKELEKSPRSAPLFPSPLMKLGRHGQLLGTPPARLPPMSADRAYQMPFPIPLTKKGIQQTSTTPMTELERGWWAGVLYSAGASAVALGLFALVGKGVSPDTLPLHVPPLSLLLALVLFLVMKSESISQSILGIIEKASALRTE